MIPRATTSNHADCQIISEEGAMPLEPIYHKDSLILPAERIEVVVKSRWKAGSESRSLGVGVILASGAAGLQIAATPDQARALARALTMCAAEIDRQIAAQAADAIERARKGPAQ